MAFRIYLEDEILRLDFSGEMTKGDFDELIATVTEHESRVPVIPHRLSDLGAITLTQNRFPEMLKLAQLRKATRFPNEFKSAIVAPSPVALGMARMFQTLNDHPQITVKIFPDLAAAQAWLAEKP